MQKDLKSKKKRSGGDYPTRENYTFSKAQGHNTLQLTLTNRAKMFARDDVCDKTPPMGAAIRSQWIIRSRVTMNFEGAWVTRSLYTPVPKGSSATKLRSISIAQWHCLIETKK